MKKTILIIIISLLTFFPGKGYAETIVSGGIFDDTVWTLAGSPYHVVGNTTLFPGKSLTIQAGVEVKLDPVVTLEIRGALYVQGELNNEVIIRANSPTDKWERIGIYDGKAIINYAKISGAKNAVTEGGPNIINEIYNTEFFDNENAFGQIYVPSNSIIDNCIFRNNITALLSGKVIYNSVFTNNINGLGYGINGSLRNISLYNCHFSGHEVALWVGDGTIFERCTISNNNVGIQQTGYISIISRNNVSNNNIGVRIIGAHIREVQYFEYNNIYNNSTYNLENGGGNDIFPINNWWGTTDLNQIRAKIYDAYDDPSRGIVYFEPILTGPVNINQRLISGKISNAYGNGVGGILVQFSNGGGEAATINDGTYSTLVDHGWSGTITPASANYTFFPQSITITSITQDIRNQDFTVGCTLTVSIEPPYGGSVAKFPDRTLYAPSEPVTLTAIPNQEHNFYHWGGDASGTANPLYNFIMNGNKRVTAVFQGAAGQLAAISGAVSDNSGNPIETADVIFEGGNVTSTVRSNASGFYEMRVVLGWSGASSARKNGYTFEPASRIYANITQDQPIQDFTGTPVPSERDCRAIIVAGSGDQGDPLWPAINHLANLAYRTMLYKGIAKGNIRYFNAKTNQDVDGNGSQDDIDGAPSSTALQHAILTWAASYVNQDKPLILYMVNHGVTDQFCLVEQPPDMLTSAQLDGWLDQVQTLRGCKVVVIYEACHSGSFLDNLLPPTSQRRIVISSARPDQQAYFGSEGRVSFSQSFWTSTLMGNHVRKSFLDAKSDIGYSTNYRQDAMMDDNGDGIWNSHADGQLAQVTYIGDPFVTGALLPEILDKTRDLFLPAGGSHEFFARVQPGMAPINRVKCVVVLPGVGGGPSTVPVTDLPTFELSYNASTDRYKGTYSGFAATGIYKITFYAEDSYGNTSLPASTEVQVVGEDGSFPVYRFWSAVYNSHHYTISALERDYILEHWSDTWTYEGIGFYARASGQGGTFPVFRFWSELFRTHHYTISEWERDYIIRTWPEAWTYEGIAFYAYASAQEGALPVYRFWSEIYHSHHYTISEWERDYILEHWPEAWTYEGIGFYMYVAP